MRGRETSFDINDSDSPSRGDKFGDQVIDEW
jgi:hypothetical protein